MTASNPTSPDPHTILDLLRSSLIPFYAKGLPTTLQLYAHLQLLSSRIRSEARRAVAEQERLIALLEQEGVDEADWLAHGALRRTDGRTLRRIGAEEGDEELTREDRMMDLSFKLRLYVSFHPQDPTCSKLTSSQAASSFTVRAWLETDFGRNSSQHLFPRFAQIQPAWCDFAL